MGQSTFKLRSGPQGYSGYSGFSGIDGHGGQVGYSGSSGYSGMIGPEGISGMVGYSGYSGMPGVGIVGPQGYSGLSGFSSYSGTSGFSGEIGGIGPQGEIGISGYSGIEGAYSSSGYSGYSGHSGINGVAGVPIMSGTLDDARVLEIEGSGATTYDQRSFFVTKDDRLSANKFPITVSNLDFENYNLIDNKGLEWTAIGSNVLVQSSYLYTLPPMINKNYPRDMVVTASDFKYNFEPWKAFDQKDDILHSWVVEDSTAWIQIELQTGIYVPDRYRISSIKHPSTYNNTGPRSWELKASTNGIDWDILDEQTDISWVSVYERDFPITSDSTSLYTYFLLDITETNDPNYLIIQQFDFLNWYEIVPLFGDNSLYIQKTPDLEIFDLNDIKNKTNHIRTTQTNIWKFKDYNWNISFLVNLDSYSGSSLLNLFGIYMVGFFGFTSIPSIDYNTNLLESTSGINVIGCAYFQNGIPEGFESLGILPIDLFSLCFFVIENSVNKVLTVANFTLMLNETYQIDVVRVVDEIKIYVDNIDVTTYGGTLSESYIFPYLNEPILLGWGMDGRIDDFNAQITGNLTNHLVMYDGIDWYDKGLYGYFDI